MKIAELNNASILLWGLGAEGQAILKAVTPRVNSQWTVYSDEPFSAEDKEFLAGYPEVSLAKESTLEALLQQHTILIKSPGVSHYRPEIQAAIKNGLRVTSGTSIWFSERNDQRAVIVTGTKGKSTSSATLFFILHTLNKKAALAGNIGVPLITHLDTQEVDFWIIELSSYQIADLTASVDAVLFTNLFSEHINWHGSQAQYEADKLRICSMVRNSGIIVAPEALLNKITATAAAPVIAYDAPEGLCTVQGQVLTIKQKQHHLPVTTFPGTHSLKNVSAVLTMLSHYGIDTDMALAALQDFTPLPHRLTPIGLFNEVLYIDDSISTIPESSLAALCSLAPRPCVLILGGFDRGVSWLENAPAILAASPKAVVCTGQNGARIQSTLSAVSNSKNTCPITYEPVFEAAVRTAINHAAPGDAVVLSPGAPSYDCFKDFRARGTAFRRIVAGEI